MVGVLASLGLGLWAVAVLGVRCSFLYRRLDDPLITRGPYGVVRHPQFLSAIGVTFFTLGLYVDMSFFSYWPDVAAGLVGAGYIGMANWVLFVHTLWLLAVLEDRELAAHFGVEYGEYVRRVPRLFPK
jgi:protein-S-isoprenylcysteine O-methyltransferase Ste14